LVFSQSLNFIESIKIETLPLHPFSSLLFFYALLLIKRRRKEVWRRMGDEREGGRQGEGEIRGKTGRREGEGRTWRNQEGVLR